MELEHWRRWRWSTEATAKELQRKTLPNPCASVTFQENLVKVDIQDVVYQVCLNICAKKYPSTLALSANVKDRDCIIPTTANPNDQTWPGVARSGHGQARPRQSWS